MAGYNLDLHAAKKPVECDCLRLGENARQDQKRISENIYNERKRQNLSQDDLAKKAGLGLSTLRRIENYESCSLEKLSRIATALNISVAELVGSPKDENEFIAIALIMHNGKLHIVDNKSEVDAFLKTVKEWLCGPESK